VASPAAAGARVNQQELPSASNPRKKLRRLKMSYACTDNPKVDVPYLRLRGRWLKEAGFDVGRNVRIEVGEGRLTIETVD